MSSTIRLGDIPPPCNAPSGGPGGVEGCPTCKRQNWGGKLVVLDVDSWKMGEGGKDREVFFFFALFARFFFFSLSTPLVVKVEEESSPFSFLSFSLSLSQNKPKTGNHGSPYVRSAYACSYSCNGYQGGAGSEGLTANAFTYCDDPKGCGENCADFTRGKAPIDGSKDRLFFGPFATAPKSVCTPENKFPYQMCSCKRVDGEGGGDESKEWVSGFTVERPAGK